MQRLFSKLLIVSGAAVLAIGALSLAEMLLSKPGKRRSAQPKAINELAVVSEPEPQLQTHPPAKPVRNFAIKRTTSEVGYTYWILEGFGRHKCFILCDTWQEAVDEARQRLADANSPSNPETAIRESVLI